MELFISKENKYLNKIQFNNGNNLTKVKYPMYNDKIKEILTFHHFYNSRKNVIYKKETQGLIILICCHSQVETVFEVSKKTS